MFERKRNIPRAIAGPNAVDQQAVERAVRWVLQKDVEQSGQSLLYMPARPNVEAEPRLQALSRQVQTETWKTLSGSRWTGGPVLAAWPDEKHLAQIDSDGRTSALCLLVWNDRDAAGWAAAHQPEQLSPGASMPAPASVADPVVGEGLKTLTALVNHGNQLAGSMDHRDAVNVLQTLQDGGHRLDPQGIYAWALANGWPAKGAQRLKELATDIAGGKRPRAVPGALRPDILQVWQDATQQ
ncbi:MAG TPA: hypothetical protein VIK11_01620 [Tepidiformaceae bacterium]